MQETLNWRGDRIGMFTASEIHKLMKGGTRPMTPEELEAAKAEKIRRTTVDTMFGDGALTYIKEVMHEILTGMEKDFGVSRAMERGLMLEPYAIEAFKERTKLEVEYFGATNPKFFPYNEFAGGSPDGLTEDAVVEVKCPNSAFLDYLAIASGYEFGSATPFSGTYNEWLAKYSFEYYCQVQMNMLVTKRSKAYFVVFDDRINGRLDRNLVILVISRDEELLSDMVLRIDAASDILSHQFGAFGL